MFKSEQRLAQLDSEAEGKKTPKQLKLSFQYVAYTNNLLLVYYFSTKYEHFLFLKRVENPPMLTLTKNVDNAAILCWNTELQLI